MPFVPDAPSAGGGRFVPDAPAKPAIPASVSGKEEGMSFDPFSFIGEAGEAVGGGAAELATKHGASPEVAGMLGVAANLGTQAIPNVIGGIGSGLVKGGAKAIRGAGEMLTPKVNPESAALARKAESMGIPVAPHMLTDNKIMRMMGEALEKVPLSGAKTEERRTAFNKAIMKTIGAHPEAEKLTPDVFDKAMTKSGSTIGDIASRNKIALDADLNTALDTHVADAMKFETSDVAKIISNYVTELKSKAVNGAIPGEAYRKLNTKIGAQMRSSTSGDLKNALGGLQEDMHEALSRNLSAADNAELLDARTKYANAKSLEAAVAKASFRGGDMSPADVMGATMSTKFDKSMMARGKKGDLGEIAKVGQRFLKEQPSSGTAERGLGYGLLGGGAAIHPATAASVLGIANIYNRAGRKVAQKMAEEK